MTRWYLFMILSNLAKATLQMQYTKTTALAENLFWELDEAFYSSWKNFWAR